MTGAKRSALRAAVLAAGTLLGSAVAGADGYVLGHGLALPAHDLVLSGYTSLHLDDLEQAGARFDLRDLSLFATWSPQPRWQVFAELEGENLVTVDGDGVSAHDTEIELERLYVDYAATPGTNLRVGRYLTPFGHWNLVHAEPLVWTATRPLSTVIAIPDHAVGAQVHGSLERGGNSLDYSLWLDDSEALDPKHGDASFEELTLPGLSNNFDHGVGLQVRYHFLDERAALGASYAAVAIDRLSGTRHLFGLDGAWRWRRFELSSELLYGDNGGTITRDDWGGFVQAVVPLRGALYGVGRLEYYSSGVLQDEVGRGSVGLAWRPLPAITYKLEYHDGSNRRLLPDGWEMSCGILF